MTIQNQDIIVHQKEDKLSFGNEINLFIKHIMANTLVVNVTVHAMTDVTKNALEKMKLFIEKNGVIKENLTKIPPRHIKEWKKINQDYHNFDIARNLLPRSLLVSLVSQYDGYLGKILKIIYIRKPEILNQSNREISFEQLNKMKSIEEARDYIINKEIETILRSSHTEQFGKISKSFCLELIPEMFDDFIEITERRNLFVHADGIISSQYMNVCKKNVIDKVKEGDQLDVSLEYFKKAYRCVFEIAVTLGHSLWRKIFPNEHEEADGNYIQITYELIETEQYDLAIRLLNFARKTLVKFSFKNQGHNLIIAINLAQCYKWKNDDENCKKIMGAYNWKVTSDQFQLADAVLLDEWPRAIEIIKKIGKNGNVKQADYHQWPLFKKLREEKIFLAVYEKIFDETFTIPLEIESKNQQDNIIDLELKVVHLKTQKKQKIMKNKNRKKNRISLRKNRAADTVISVKHNSNLT